MSYVRGLSSTQQGEDSEFDSWQALRIAIKMIVKQLFKDYERDFLHQVLGAEEFDDVSEIQITSLQIDFSRLNPRLTDISNPELKARIDNCNEMIVLLAGIGLREIGLESLSELLDEELARKVCVD